MLGGAFRADKGRDEFTGDGALIEACAVLADIEEVGGPDENMERFGVLKREDCCTGAAWVARSSSGIEGVWRRELVDMVNVAPAEEDCVGGGGGEALEGKTHVGSWAVER